MGEGNPAPDLAQIEEIVLKLREEMGVEMAASVLKGQEKRMPAVEKCKTCGKEMGSKGQKRKVIENVMERGYYYCEECGAGIFPPGSATQGKGGQNENVSRLAVWFSGLVSFERAAEILMEAGGITCLRGTVWAQSLEWGAQFQAQEEQARKQAG